MTGAGIDTKELERFLTKLGNSRAALREARRQAMEAAGPKLKTLLDGEIGGTGKVRRWQEAAVGSGGGYSAVRPKANTWAEDGRGRTTRYQVGRVTKAIESGHAFPAPGGKQGYRPRIRSGRMSVPGRHFYEAAQARVPEIAREAAEQVLDALKQHLEG